VALTIDEVLASWQPSKSLPNGVEVSQVQTTLLLTQEDGHASWGQALFDIDPVKKIIVRGIPRGDTAFNFEAAFSDSYWTKPRQIQGIEIKPGGTGACHIHGVLWQWGGATFDADVSLLPNPSTAGKIYFGRGPTFAHGSGAGVYILTFGSVVRTQVVIG
jgi:hypothetical protein